MEKSKIVELTSVLSEHPLYQNLESLADLQFFMENHVYAVFDFMSLTKGIQNHFAPINTIWTPPKKPELARFINEVILGEESDQLPDGRFMSHFEMYLLAMEEVGANTTPVRKFVEYISHGEIAKAFEEACPFPAAKRFTKSTLGKIGDWEIHQLVASFCYGREKVIPKMFQSLADKCGLTEENCPLFFFYLNRHIELDGDEHGPLADKMLEAVTLSDKNLEDQAIEAAIWSLERRIEFWNELNTSLTDQKQALHD